MEKQVVPQKLAKGGLTKLPFFALLASCVDFLFLSFPGAIPLRFQLILMLIDISTN